MGQNQDITEKIIELLAEQQNKPITIRNIAILASLSRSTAQRYVTNMKQLNLINRENHLIITPYTKFLKSSIMIKKLFTSGLIDYLEKQLVPSTIILFGSVRKGDYVKESDIDLFIETTKKDYIIDLKLYEKKLRHTVHVFIEQDINTLPPGLLNNVLNGIKLTGYVRLNHGK